MKKFVFISLCLNIALYAGKNDPYAIVTISNSDKTNKSKTIQYYPILSQEGYIREKFPENALLQRRIDAANSISHQLAIQQDEQNHQINRAANFQKRWYKLLLFALSIKSFCMRMSECCQ